MNDVLKVVSESEVRHKMNFDEVTLAEIAVNRARPIRYKLHELRCDIVKLDISKLQDVHKGEYYCLKEIVSAIKVCDEHTYQIFRAKYDTLKLLIEYIDSKES